MRKCLTVSIVLLLLLFQTTCIAFAAVKAAGADIPVVIDGGGTAYMIPEFNSPLPKEVTIRVGNGRTGHFYIDFTEAGIYRYTIKAGFSRPDGEIPADEVFQVTITVVEQDGTLYTVSVINGSHSSAKPDEVRFKETSDVSEPQTETPDTPGIPTFPSGGSETVTMPTGITQTATIPADTTETTTKPDDTTETTTKAIVPPVPPETPGTPNTPETPETPGTPETPRVFRIFRAPKTGDETHLAYYLLIAMASSAGLFGLAMLYATNTKKLIKKD